MAESIVTILARFRRRLLVTRAAEAAAVAASAGALLAAALMAARILAGAHPLISAGVCGLPLAGGVLLAMCPPAGRAVSARPFLRRYVAALGLVGGSAAAAVVLAGRAADVPKNALALLVPAAAALAVAVVVLRGARLAGVAIDVDRRAALRERLSTAWELDRAGEGSPFAEAVKRQAVSAAGEGRLARIRFWDRTPATLGALGLSLAAVAVLLPWSPLDSPADRQARRWTHVAAPVGDLLAQELAALKAEALAGGGDLAGVLGRLEKLAGVLRQARPAEAAKWQGRVVELDELARALRQIVRSGRAGPEAGRRITRLLRTIEQAAADIAEAMTAPGQPPARGGGPGVRAADVRPSRPADGAPAGWTTVFNPQYLRHRGATTAATGPPRPLAPPAQVPYDRQWFAARARAARALESAAIPQPYRQLVRDFFAQE